MRTEYFIEFKNKIGNKIILPVAVFVILVATLSRDPILFSFGLLCFLFNFKIVKTTRRN